MSATQTYEIEMKTGSTTQVLYVEAQSEGQAMLKARAIGRRTLSTTAFRFATFTFC